MLLAILGTLVLIATIAIPAGFILLLFKQKRKTGVRMVVISIISWPVLIVFFGSQIRKEEEREAAQAGFENYGDLKIAKEAGVTDAKAFYANAAVIRAQVEQTRREKEARERSDREAREARERSEADAAAARAKAEARRAKFELAEPAPLDQQPPVNTDFGRQAYRYSAFLRTAAGYPFIRAREDVPLCTDHHSAKEAGDALRSKDQRWAESIRNCTIYPQGTAMEWVKDTLFLPVVTIRIRTPDGGRRTVYAPDSTTDGIPFWMGFYDLAEMRAKAAKAQ